MGVSVGYGRRGDEGGRVAGCSAQAEGMGRIDGTLSPKHSNLTPASKRVRVHCIVLVHGSDVQSALRLRGPDVHTISADHDLRAMHDLRTDKERHPRSGQLFIHEYNESNAHVRARRPNLAMPAPPTTPHSSSSSAPVSTDPCHTAPDAPVLAWQPQKTAPQTAMVFGLMGQARAAVAVSARLPAS